MLDFMTMRTAYEVLLKLSKFRGLFGLNGRQALIKEWCRTVCMWSVEVGWWFLYATVRGPSPPDFEVLFVLSTLGYSIGLSLGCQLAFLAGHHLFGIDKGAFTHVSLFGQFRLHVPYALGDT